MNTFDDDNELGPYDEERRRPPRERTRRPKPSGPAAGSSVLRLAGLVALGIAVVFGLVLWIGSCSGQSKQDYTSYITSMRALANDSASVGAKFSTALRTPALTMQSFQSDLADWSGQEKADYVAAQRLQPPGPLQSAHAEALATFQLRYNSLDRLAKHLTIAQSEHAGAAVVAAALASDAQLLSASDTVWEELFRLPAKDTLTAQNVFGGVPASRIVKNPDIVSAPVLATLYQRLGTPSAGHHVTGIHGSDLIGTNAVENGVTKALSTSSGTTLAVGPGLVINVVFLNSGNYAEVQIPVTLTVKAGDKRLYTKTNTVSQVAPKAQATVPFTNIELPPEAFSHNADISVNIGKVPGEARLDNNQATYPVFFRIAPS